MVFSISLNYSTTNEELCIKFINKQKFNHIIKKTKKSRNCLSINGLKSQNILNCLMCILYNKINACINIKWKI